MRADFTRKVPPFGKVLFQRRLYANPPFLIVVCLGAGAFARARGWNGRGADYAGLVLPDAAPDGYVWPLAGSHALIEWAPGPAETLVAHLAYRLHRAGALSVTSQCLADDYDAGDWDEGLNRATGRWERLRHGIHFYRFADQRSRVA